MINVSVWNKTKTKIKNILSDYHFLLNDNLTRHLIEKNLISLDYVTEVICDRTNNPSSEIDKRFLHVDIKFENFEMWRFSLKHFGIIIMYKLNER